MVCVVFKSILDKRGGKMEKDKGGDPGAGGCLLQRAGSPSRGVVLRQWGSGHRSAGRVRAQGSGC